MLPIGARGTLGSIEGIEPALAVPGITDFSQTIPNGRTVVPLPEGDRYLGFLFAEGPTPREVEEALREALQNLVVTIR
jgi:hypothetical protein